MVGSGAGGAVVGPGAGRGGRRWLVAGRVVAGRGTGEWERAHHGARVVWEQIKTRGEQ